MIYDNEINTVKIVLEAKKITKQWKPNVEHVRQYMKG